MARKVRRDKKPRVQQVCKECGKAFEIRQSQVVRGEGVFCSHQCNGRHNGRNSGRAPVRCSCKMCGGEFYARPDDIDAGRGLYCSPKCYGAARTSARLERKRQHPFICQGCGKVFIDQSRNFPKRQFCSNQCRAKASRQAVKAKGKRKWKHRKWSRAVILRDKACARCGARENLQAHHIKSFQRHPELRDDISNGVALCVYCHHSQHPKQPLEQFTKTGGQAVRYCVVCESPYICRPKQQQTCSRRCGQLLHHVRRRKGENTCQN